MLRLTCVIWMIPLGACVLSPVAWLYPDVDTGGWEIIVEDEVLGDRPNTSGVFEGFGECCVLSRTVDNDRMVEVIVDGAVVLIDLQTSRILESRDLGAVAAAWSNDGRRLAVVTRDTSLPSMDAHAVAILDDELSDVERIPVDLPLPDSLSSYETFVVSWSEDDSQIAVSSDAIPPLCIPSLRNVSVLARCVVLTLGETAAQSTYELTNVYFLNDDWVVGTIPESARVQTASASNRVYAMRLDKGEIRDRRHMLGAEFTVASNSPAGLFVSAEESAGYTPCERNLYLRSRTGHSRVSTSTWFAGMPAALFRKTP